VKAVVALFALMVFAFACGPKHSDSGTTKKNEISNLWTQIRGWRLEAGLPVEPRHEDVISVVGTPVKEVQRVCPEGHNVPETCNDVCSLADAICDNAEQICILADELGKQDTWAQGKCASAKASCRDAKKKCCGCSEDTENQAP
jgi:hypothetical protein